MRLKKMAAIAAGVVLAGSTGFAGTTTVPTNLVLNGSFETPVIAPGSYQWSKGVLGWDGLGDFELDSNGSFGPGQGGTTFGNQYTELNAIYPTKIIQFVKTTVGQTYLLSFYLSARPGTTNNVTSVFVTGVGATSYPLPDVSTLTFKQYTETFKATTNLTELSFNALKSSIPGEGNELDNISLIAQSAATASAAIASPAPSAQTVPVPKAFWPGLIGLAALAVPGVLRKIRRV